MAKSKVTVNSKAILNRMHKAWAAVNETDLPQAFDYSLGADIWSWPRATVRRNGTVAGRIRNAVDEGDLADSYRRTRRGTTYVHSWNAPHALIVHSGATLTNGTVLPPRPWTDEGVDAIPQLFAKRYRELGP